MRLHILTSAFRWWIPAGKQRFALIVGGREMAPGQHVHLWGSCCHWSFNFTGDQSGFNLGPHQTCAQLRPRPEGEDVRTQQVIKHPMVVDQGHSCVLRANMKKHSGADHGAHISIKHQLHQNDQLAENVSWLMLCLLYRFYFTLFCQCAYLHDVKLHKSTALKHFWMKLLQMPF